MMLLRKQQESIMIQQQKSVHQQGSRGGNQPFEMVNQVFMNF
jgi:hypothetical protein